MKKYNFFKKAIAISGLSLILTTPVLAESEVSVLVSNDKANNIVSTIVLATGGLAALASLNTLHVYKKEMKKYNNNKMR